MSFFPRFCPRADCPSRCGGAPFSFWQRGAFQRKCDRLVVPRFRCLTCRRGFSEQTFRVNYRLKRPDLLAPLFLDRISKVTHRQSARNHACSRSTEERQFRRLSEHCEAFHGARMDEIGASGGLGAVFLLDELETYEHDRLKKPVTVPILIERESGFVLDTRVGTLPPRVKPGQGKRREQAKPAEPGGETKSDAHPPPLSVLEGERKSESREVVKAAFERLRSAAPKEKPLRVVTDEKSSYAALLRELFGARCEHMQVASTLRRDTRNPLFAINHTLARVRDNVSRLVRETWASAKLRRWLAGQLAIWTCYRNYVRDMTNKTARTTPAMALGAHKKPWEVPWDPLESTCRHASLSIL